jgi:hypothetical protein
MAPWYSVEFVPPSVKTPPGSSTAADWTSSKRVMKKENSGLVSKLLAMRACQKGTALVLAMPWNARPMIPESLPLINPEDRALIATELKSQSSRMGEYR